MSSREELIKLTVALETEIKSPINNFVFVKTHKTGSTTLTNVLLRYTETHGLNVLLDARAHGNTEYGDLTKRTFIPVPPGSKHNAFMLHANYNPQFLRSKLGEDTTFITTLRDPVSQFIAGFNYLGYHNKYYKSMGFEGAVNKYVDESEGFGGIHTNCQHRDCDIFVNAQSKYLGLIKLEEYLLAEDADRKHDLVRDYIDKLEDELDLVLITEDFTLSMLQWFLWHINTA